MDMTTAVKSAQRSLDSVQNTIETLKSSARTTNDAVFKKAINNLLKSIEKSREDLDVIKAIKTKDTSVTDAIKPSFIDSVNRTLHTINSLEQDADIQVQVGALQYTLFWDQLQGYKTIIKMTAANLKGLRRGERVAGIDEMHLE